MLIFIGTLCDRMIQKRNVRVSLNYRFHFCNIIMVQIRQKKFFLFENLVTVWSLHLCNLHCCTLHNEVKVEKRCNLKFKKYVWVVVVEDFIPSEIWFHEIFFLHFFADFSTLCSSSLLCFSSKKRHVHTSCQHAKGNEFIHEMLEEERNIIVGLLYNSYIPSISTNSATFWTPERFLEVFPKKNPTTIIFMKTWSEDTLQK